MSEQSVIARALAVKLGLSPDGFTDPEQVVETILELRRASGAVIAAADRMLPHFQLAIRLCEAAGTDTPAMHEALAEYEAYKLTIL